MNFFTKTKFLIAVIIVLSAIIIAIFGTIGFHYIKYEKRSIVKPKDNQQPGRFMAKQLMLTPEQIKEFDSLRNKFHEDLNSLTKDIKSTSRSINEEIISENSSQTKLDSLAKRFGELQSQQKTIMINHFLEIKGKCNPKQRTNFYKFLKRMENRDMNEADRNRERQRTRENR